MLAPMFMSMLALGLMGGPILAPASSTSMLPLLLDMLPAAAPIQAGRFSEVRWSCLMLLLYYLHDFEEAAVFRMQHAEEIFSPSIDHSEFEHPTKVGFIVGAQRLEIKLPPRENLHP